MKKAILFLLWMLLALPLAAQPSGQCYNSSQQQTTFYNSTTYACVCASGGYPCYGTWQTLGSPYTLPIATTSVLGGIKPDGTTITVNSSTGVAKASGSDSFSGDMRPTVIQTIGKGPGGTGVALAASSTVQIFSVASGNAGTITFLHLTLGTTGADSPNLVQNSTLSIDCDGNTQTVPLGLFFLTEDAPTAFNADNLSVPLMSSTFIGNISLNRRTWIDFYNSCTISLTNASSSATADVFIDVNYRAGVDPSPGVHGYWNAVSTPLTAVAANTGVWDAAQFTLLPSNAYSGGGQVEELVDFYNSSTNWNYLEASPTIIADSTMAAVSGGGEDWGLCGYYCASGANPTNTIHTDKSGFMASSDGLQDAAGTNDALIYRWFWPTPGDNLFFTSTLAAYTANGDSYVSPGTVNIAGLITYWTAIPTATPVTFSPTAGNYTGTQTVSLTDGTSGAVICYTTDGTTPTASAGNCTHGTTYSTAISVSSSETVSAITTLSGYNNGVLSSAAYTITIGKFSYVGSDSKVCSSATSCALTAFTPAANDELIICGAGGQTTSGPTLTLSGMGSNSVVAFANNPASYTESSFVTVDYCWYVLAAANSQITPSVASNGSAGYMEIFRLETSSTSAATHDTDAAGTLGTAATSCPTGSISTAGNNELLVAVMSTQNDGLSSSISGGAPNAWVQAQELGPNYHGLYYQLNANKVTTQTYSASMTSGQCSSLIGAFK